jgi:hypothetical protein
MYIHEHMRENDDFYCYLTLSEESVGRRQAGGYRAVPRSV